MKHQQVLVDYWAMVKTSLTYLALVASVFVLFRMTYAVFMLPRALRRSQEQLSERLLELQQRIKLKEQAEKAAAAEKAITEAGEEDDQDHVDSESVANSPDSPVHGTIATATVIVTESVAEEEPKKEL